MICDKVDALDFWVAEIVDSRELRRRRGHYSLCSSGVYPVHDQRGNREDTANEKDRRGQRDHTTESRHGILSIVSANIHELNAQDNGKDIANSSSKSKEAI